MAGGFTCRVMEMSGSRISRRIGRPIRQAAGLGSRIMDGPGYRMNRGDGPHTITDVGSSQLDTGIGGQVLCTLVIARYGRPHLCSLWALGRVPDSASAPLDGFR